MSDIAKPVLSVAIIALVSLSIAGLLQITAQVAQ